MKKLIAAFALGFASLLPMGAPLAQPIAKQTTYALIVCESPNGQQSFCRADVHRGVRMLREISRNRCFEGRTFGYENDGIWISGGCAAEFEIGRGNAPGQGSGPGSGGHGNQGEVIICESRDGRRAYCDANTRHGVTLLRQLSRNDCVEGQTWGQDQRGIWVDLGCRGEFETGRGGGGGSYPPSGPGPDTGQYLGTIICRSEGGLQQICPAEIGRNRVELLRRISKKPCVQGHSWGYDRRSVWVGNGCRGEFGVVRVAEPRLVVCESVQERRQYCTANTVYGVQLNRQLSRSPCTEGYSWGYDRNAIWVDQGCRAEFLVE